MGVVILTSQGAYYSLACTGVLAIVMARLRDISTEEMSNGVRNYDSDGDDSQSSSKNKGELSLSCDYSLFESGSSGLDVADGWAPSATIEPYQYEPLDSHSSDSAAERSSDDESEGAERLLNTEW